MSIFAVLVVLIEESGFIAEIFYYAGLLIVLLYFAFSIILSLTEEDLDYAR